MAKNTTDIIDAEEVSGTDEVANKEDTKETKDRDFVVSEKVLVVTLNYLAQRPYAEVAELIQALRQSKLA